MGNYQKQALINSSCVLAGAQVRSQSALGATEDAFHLPTSSVFLGGKTALHVAAIATTRRGFWMTTVIDRNDGFGNAPVLATTAVMLFGVIGGIAKQAADTYVARSLFHRRQEARRVVAGTTTDNRRQNEVTAMIGYDGQLEVTAETASAAGTLATIDKVATDVVRFQTRRIDTDFTGRRQQSQFATATNEFS